MGKCNFILRCTNYTELNEIFQGLCAVVSTGVFLLFSNINILKSEILSTFAQCVKKLNF